MTTNRTLTYEEWQALADAEAAMYRGEHGAHAYTSVNPLSDGRRSPMLVALWEHAEEQVAVGFDGDLEETEETARRVAAMLAVAAFGVEYGSELSAKAAI